ncbi:MAG TPA: hypothetical protein VMB50_04760 [Myxococcales bacterium]|nr:hypothetical protein [Myxococcales bacterium]
MPSAERRFKPSGAVSEITTADETGCLEAFEDSIDRHRVASTGSKCLQELWRAEGTVLLQEEPQNVAPLTSELQPSGNQQLLDRVSRSVPCLLPSGHRCS